jgi:type IV secretion system protein VirD4
MASVMSTVLSRLNAFLDSELEQVLCFDSAIDAEKFGSKICHLLILPEEDTTKNFMAGLMIQNLSREIVRRSG